MRHGFHETQPGRAQQRGHVSFVSGNTIAIVTLQELKDHLRVRHADEDDLIAADLETAIDEIDMPRKAGFPPGWLGRALGTRKLRLTLDQEPPFTIYLPGSPVTSIDKVEFRKTDDTFEEVLAAEFISDLTAEPAKIWPKEAWPHGQLAWPIGTKGGPDSFRVEYTTGYVDADATPAVIKQWIMIRAAELYRDREGTVIGTSPATLEHILFSYSTGMKS